MPSFRDLPQQSFTSPGANPLQKAEAVTKFLAFYGRAGNALRKPVVVFFGLHAFVERANLRHYRFLVEGLPELAAGHDGTVQPDDRNDDDGGAPGFRQQSVEKAFHEGMVSGRWVAGM